MKRLIKRIILRHQLASTAAQLEAITREREDLARLEHHLLVRANLLRVKLLYLDIEARCHA
ncbi:hypothetical protein [Paraburkholderia sp. Ac-20347]|uniref:hypothetical protein n=1 Tax=Paraburkholderia sp. Ac-20347 TaxID=2703892 RepID=UPI00197DE41B|nr:hypothetical protein [Paraburkholderia sp. Ac-20347]MBN3809441.1 hypothetical protein [Paraburkholderia sp. Ac-20347]